MLIYRPDYFDRFRCIAGACPDSCCKEWGVQVDAASAEYYRSLPGVLGDRLREVLSDEDGETVMTIIDGRCPMWRTDGLCRIQAELGEQALCKTCREFPRLTHDYGDYVELGLELSCPEAAKLILEAAHFDLEIAPQAFPSVTTPVCRLVRDESCASEPEYDEEAMDVLKSTREIMLSILSDPSRPIGEILALGLLYGYQAQSQLDGAEQMPFDGDAALDSVQELAKPGDMQEILDFFLGLELLTPEWEALLHSPAPADWDGRTLALARYLVNRYWLQAVSDYDLYSRVKFIVIACLLCKHLGGDLLRTAQLFSKEIENDVDNVEAILDGAYANPAFTDNKLLGILLS